MSKEQLLCDINKKRACISEANSELARLERRYEELCDLQTKVQRLQEGFCQSVIRQRSRLPVAVGLATTMRTARMYHGKMTEALSGREFSNANSHIAAALAETKRNKQRVASEIEQARQKIGSLSSQLRSLQYAYNTYPEED
ncbi:MAG: hypothetical protein LBP28_02915 [Coriobacteriales bacterium]|jgi:multidrug resistance efflux pump|nr:hypothetical protein [Coriobacteriales bacterium]